MTREPTEMELGVSEAIATAYERKMDGVRSVPHYMSPEERGRTLASRWLPEARAAIRAMREPTREMLAALSPEECPHTWYALIDAASPEDTQA